MKHLLPTLPVDRLWDGEMAGVSVQGNRVLIVHAAGAFFAYRDACAHLQVPLSEGSLEGTTLTCRAHQWTYDVTTGRGMNPRAACLHRLELEVRDGIIYVEDGA